MRRLLGFGAVLVASGVLLVGSFVRGTTVARAQDGDSTRDQPHVWFHDDFTTRANRWRLFDLDKAVIVYDDSALNMRAKPASYALWSVPDTDLKPDRYDIEVDAKINGGETDARVGMILGYRSESDMLVMAVTRAGTVYLGHYYFGVWKDVIAPSKVKLDAKQVITLRATIDANHALRLFVNGLPAGKTTIKDFKASSFGLFALSGKKGGVDVAFSRFVVSDLQ